jgi:hypothetical protein
MKKILKNIRRTVRLSEEEDKKLTQIRKRRGQTVSEYFRRRLESDK